YDAQALQDFLQLLEQQDGTDDLDEHNVAAQIAIACADDDTRPDAATLGDRLTQFNQQSDLFAEVFISVAGLCSVWPPALEPLELISTRTAPTALVIGGTSDASTPIEWSEQMTESIGGFFLRSEHSGHTSVYNQESECVDQYVTSFLLDGELPDLGSCGTETPAGMP
ncbi:MAG: alpha/beta hydrolase, partial [Granulosicoccus sp.]|nr:alpha/beta hydrolase [Granulosicoccus sp.]